MKTVFAGLHYIWSKKLILGAISLDLFAVLLGGAVALLPVYASEILHTGPWGGIAPYCARSGCGSHGGVVGTSAVARTIRARRCSGRLPGSEFSRSSSVSRAALFFRWSRFSCWEPAI